MSEIRRCLTCGADIDGNNDAHFMSDQGDKWGHIVCCGGPEVRTSYDKLGYWKDDAIEAWNDQWGNREIDRLTASLAEAREERDIFKRTLDKRDEQLEVRNQMSMDNTVILSDMRDELTKVREQLKKTELERDAFRDELFTDHLKEVMQKCTEQQIEIFDLKKQLKKYEGAVEVEGLIDYPVCGYNISLSPTNYLRVSEKNTGNVTVWVKRREG